MWTVHLEDQPRDLNRNEFHRPELARRGDKWHCPSQGYNDFMIVEYVTKYIDPELEAIWYVVTFSNPQPHLKGLHIGENMGLGTFYKNEMEPTNA